MKLDCNGTRLKGTPVLLCRLFFYNFRQCSATQAICKRLLTDTVNSATHRVQGAAVLDGTAKCILVHKDVNIVGDIKIRRLEWAGHIIRMEDERIPKNVHNGKFHNTRPAGKPRKRWEDVVRKDPRNTRGRRRRAEDREEWRRLLRETRDQRGLQHHRWMDGWMFGVQGTFPTISVGRHELV